MAWIEIRTSRTGVITHAVKWREGGRRVDPAGTRTLDDPDDAAKLVGLIETNGHRFPSRDQLLAFGLDVLVDDPPAAADAITVTDLVTRYLAQLARKLGGPAPDSLRQYGDYLRCYVAPSRLGKMLAYDVDWEDVEDWQHDLHTSIVAPAGRKPLAPNTIAGIRSRVLAPAFKWAASARGRQLLEHNPMVDALAPARDHTYRRPILTSPAEYAVMLECARVIDPYWAAMLEVQAVTGPRFSEITAMGAGAVDVARNRIGFVEHVSAGQIVPGTKNRTIRTVPVPADVMTRCIVPRLDGPLVFRQRNGDQWTTDTDLYRWKALRKALAARGITRHLTSHSMRKGYATWLKTSLPDRSAIDPDKVALAMGHIPTGITGRHYTDLTDADHDAIRAAIAPLVGADVTGG